MNHTFELIPLTIETRGEIISSNLDEFRELVREALGNINRDLKTDEEFGQAELDVKGLKNWEDAVRGAALKAFDEKLKALVESLDQTAEEIRAPRLELEKLISKRKEEVKAEIIEEFIGAYDIEPSVARKQFLGGLQSSINGKRTLDSMRTACRVYQATTQATIKKARAVIDSFEKAHGPDLIMDRRELELGKPESVEAELRRRWEAKKAAEEAARLRAEADKAKAEAAEASRKLAEANMPPAPPPIKGTVETMAGEPGPAIQVGGDLPPVAASESIGEEWKRFRSTFLQAFGPLRSARDELKHSANIAKAAGLAAAVNKAWSDWN